jgi:hypothetical protein
MIIAARYSFNGGQQEVETRYPHLLAEIETALASIDAEKHRTKQSREKTMMGQMLYSPVALNAAIKAQLLPQGWINRRVECVYSSEYYTEGYRNQVTENVGFRDMDFVKEKLGVEIQFGKYSFMVYNVAAKMTIFRNLGFIDTGIEVVPVKQFALQMSSGVSYFEQFTWDLEQRGVSNIDVPVLILGIDSEAGTTGKRQRQRVIDTEARVVREEDSAYPAIETQESEKTV